MGKVTVTTSAKINIGLWVFGTRPDGFHNIQSIFFPVNESNSNLLGDTLSVEEGCFCGAGKVRLLTSGITIGGEVSHNICVKAYNLLDQKFNLPPVKIFLEKNVPIGAGLGGGSADGVYMLKALNQLFNLSLSDSDLTFFAAKLGSDCPFFIKEQPALIEGRGEIISPLAGVSEIIDERIAELNNDYKIEIVPSDVFISTPHAYSIVKERGAAESATTDECRQSLLNLFEQPIEQWQNSIVNDFEEPVFKEYPQLRKIKESLLQRGAIYASMTGSGSAVYGLFYFTKREGI